MIGSCDARERSWGGGGCECCVRHSLVPRCQLEQGCSLVQGDTHLPPCPLFRMGVLSVSREGDCSQGGSVYTMQGGATLTVRGGRVLTLHGGNAYNILGVMANHSACWGCSALHLQDHGCIEGMADGAVQRHGATLPMQSRKTELYW